MAHALLPIVLVLTTSAALFALGRSRLGSPGGAVRTGLSRLLEWVGLTVALTLANVALGLGVALTLRALGVFLSSYYAADASVPALSAVQAWLLQEWLDGGREKPTAP